MTRVRFLHTRRVEEPVRPGTSVARLPSTRSVDAYQTVSALKPQPAVGNARRDRRADRRATLPASASPMTTPVPLPPRPPVAARVPLDRPAVRSRVGTLACAPPPTTPAASPSHQRAAERVLRIRSAETSRSTLTIASASRSTGRASSPRHPPVAEPARPGRSARRYPVATPASVVLRSEVNRLPATPLPQTRTDPPRAPQIGRAHV